MSDKAKHNRSQHTQLRPRDLSLIPCIAQWIFSLLLRIWFETKFKLTVRGREHVPKDWTPLVIVGNHTSSLDPPLLSAILFFRPISYMSKRELFEKSVWGLFFFKAIAAIAVDREKLDVSTIKSCLTVMKEGQWALGIFPEGTRQPLAPDGSTIVGPLKPGAAYIAKATRATILPVGIVRQPPKNGHGKPRINVQFGAPFSYREDADATLDEIRTHLETLVEVASNPDFGDNLSS